MRPLGACLDYANPAARPTSTLYQFPVARLEARPDNAWDLYATALQLAGVKVAVCLDGEALPDRTRWAEQASLYAKRFIADWWVIGNEPDAPSGSEASWTMTPAEYGALWVAVATTIHRIQPNAALVIAGMSTGQPDVASRYVREARLTGTWPNAIDVHLYPDPDAPGDPAPLLQQYHSLCALPVLCLEWNVSAAQIPAFANAVLSVAQANCFYAWADNQMPGRALRDGTDHPTAAYDALLQVAKGEPMTKLDDFIKANVKTVKQVYRRSTMATGWGPFGPGTEVAACDGGLLVADPTIPGVYLLTDVTYPFPTPAA